MNTLKLEIGDVIVTTDNKTVRIALKSNEANQFITLAQANKLLANNQILLVAVDIEGDEVLMSPAEAIEYRANTEGF